MAHQDVVEGLLHRLLQGRREVQARVRLACSRRAVVGVDHQHLPAVHTAGTFLRLVQGLLEQRLAGVVRHRQDGQVIIAADEAAGGVGLIEVVWRDLDDGLVVVAEPSQQLQAGQRRLAAGVVVVASDQDLQALHQVVALLDGALAVVRLVEPVTAADQAVVARDLAQLADRVEVAVGELLAGHGHRMGAPLAADVRVAEGNEQVVSFGHLNTRRNEVVRLSSSSASLQRQRTINPSAGDSLPRGVL